METTPAVQTAELVPMNESLSLSNARHTEYLAKDLAKFIRENKLFNNIQGKEYVNVEGWLYAGARLGILPIVDDCIRMPASDDKPNEIKYEAKVKLVHAATGQTVGSAKAICSNAENTKKGYQEYAIESMSQTRAIGKAYRNMLAWIIRAAGYQPTPAEEMVDLEPSAEEKKLKAITEILHSKDRNDLGRLYKKHKAYADDEDFLKAIQVMGLVYPKPVEAPVETPAEPIQQWPDYS
jgi:hypothetical protein